FASPRWRSSKPKIGLAFSSRSRYSFSFEGSLALCDTLRTPTLTEPDHSGCASWPWTSAGANRPATSTVMSFGFMSFAPLAEEEFAAHRRRVAAVHLVMAVVAAARDQPRVGRRRLPAAARVIDRARMARGVVAVLAQVGRLLLQQPRVVRAVRVVADEAVLLDRRMAPDEGAALLGVAGGAELRDRLGVDHRLRQRAVRVVAVGAVQLALDDRMVRGFQQLRADLLVAGGAGLVLQLPL